MGKMKAQAAMEYLINYSWVIVTVTIVLGILVASGAFNPAGYNKDYAVGPSVVKVERIYGEFSDLNGQGSISLILRNDFGFDVYIRTITLTYENGNTVTLTSSYDPSWENSEKIDLEYDTDSSTMSSGRMNRYELTIVYSPCNEGTCATDGYTIQKTIYVSPQKP